MIGRLMTRVLDAKAGWAKPLGDAVHDVLHAFFHRIAPLRDLLNGRWLGHPLHAAGKGVRKLHISQVEHILPCRSSGEVVQPEVCCDSTSGFGPSPPR